MHFSQSVQLSLALAGAAVAKTVMVDVSNQNNELKFFPNSVQADMGDMVQFVFNPINHSVAESASYDSACEPMAGGAGFNSGFQPVKPGSSEMATFTVMINDMNPHWFYCAQGKHCEDGMVGVINPPSNATAEGFAANAAKYNKTTIPESVYGGTAGTMSASNSTGGNSSSMGSSSSMMGGSSTSMAGASGPSPTSARGSPSGTGSASSSMSSAGAANMAAGAGFAAAIGAAVAALL